MSMKTVNADITRAVEALTGVKGVKVAILSGVARFYSDEKVFGSIAAPTLSTYPPERWAAEFAELRPTEREAVPLVAETLQAFIDRRYNGNQSAFGRDNNVQRQQVTQWLNADFIVVNGRLYSQRRRLK